MEQERHCHQFKDQIPVFPQLFNASAVITVTSRNKILKRLLSGTNSTYGFIFTTDYYYRRSLTQKTYPTQQQHQQTRTFQRRTRKCARSHTNQSLPTSASSREIVTSGKIEVKWKYLIVNGVVARGRESSSDSIRNSRKVNLDPEQLFPRQSIKA
jgi:hypothetical protein